VVKSVKNFYRFADGSVQITPESSFSKDLGLDSLDSAELIMAFEDEFSIEIPDQDTEHIHSVADTVKYIMTHPQAK